MSYNVKTLNIFYQDKKFYIHYGNKDYSLKGKTIQQAKNDAYQVLDRLYPNTIFILEEVV